MCFNCSFNHEKSIKWLSMVFGVLFLIFYFDFAIYVSHYVIEIYMRILRLLSLPILFFSILSTTSSLRSSKRWQGVFYRVIFVSLITTLLSAIVAACVFAYFKPVGSSIAYAPNQAMADPLLSLVPDNIIQMFLSFNVIAVVGLGLVLGYATAHISDEDRELLEGLSRALFGVFVYLARQLIALLPYVLWAFVINWYAMWTSHWQSILDIISYAITVLVANTIQGFIVLPCVLLFCGINPWQVFKSSLSALSVAFLSKSSAATLPVSMSVCTDKLGLEPDYVAMSLPLCTSVNMNGCAAFIYITVNFVALSHGIVWGISDHLLWLLLSVVAAFGNAGVPMGCYFMASAFLVMLDLPTQWMQLILPFYLFLDMYETAINVWSDIGVISIVSKQHKVNNG